MTSYEKDFSSSHVTLRHTLRELPHVGMVDKNNVLFIPRKKHFIHSTQNSCVVNEKDDVACFFEME